MGTFSCIFQVGLRVHNIRRGGRDACLLTPQSQAGCIHGRDPTECLYKQAIIRSSYRVSITWSTIAM